MITVIVVVWAAVATCGWARCAWKRAGERLDRLVSDDLDTAADEVVRVVRHGERTRCAPVVRLPDRRDRSRR